MSNIPKLRFKEFSGEWDEKVLDKIALFSKGKGVSKADLDENGKTECIRYGELYTKYNELIQEIESRTSVDIKDLVFSEYGDIIIPASGETQIDIATASCVLKDNVALGGDLNIIKTKEDGVFLSYYLNNAKKFDIARLSQGISVVHLYSSQLKTLKLNLPSKQEQEKIASFLTSVDTKIEQLSRKVKLLESYKKGVMQKIFLKESAEHKSGSLRFKADDGSEFPEWEEKKLGDIGNTYNGLTGKTSENFGSGKPYIQYKQIFDNAQISVDGFGYVSIEPNEKQNKAQFGDIFFTTSSETPNEVAFASVLLDKIEEVYLNSFCFGYRPKSLNTLNPHFAKYLFRSANFRKEAIKLAQGSTRYNISKVELMKTVLQLPCLEEQTKIANFLSSIDTKIEQTKSQLDSSKEFKKALLQQMFV